MASSGPMTATSKIPPATKFAVVVGLDFTDADGPAFDLAVRLLPSVPGTELHLLHVFSEAPSAERSKDLADHLRLYVDEKAAILEGLRGITVGVHLRGGKVVREILQLATDVDAKLIVVGSHKGPHIKDWIAGSTVERLVSSGTFPVIAAAAKAKEPEKHEPAIEPPCPQCVQTRIASGGKQWWCERHTHAASLGHTYSYQREIPFSTHDSSVSPTGIE
jgi:nucleotide-binding universal stress UspA family protein